MTTYKRGHLYCGMCGEWIKKEEISKLTRKSKKGNKLLHAWCGMPLKQNPNITNQESIERIKIRQRQSPIKFTRKYHMRSDILLNKEKWENLLKSEA